MKRICLVPFDLSVTGGVEQVTVGLSAKLCDFYDVYIYAITRTGDKLAYELDPRLTYYEGLRGKDRLRYMIKNTFPRFRKFIKENKIETVLLMENHPAFITLWARFFLGVKFIYCDHGSLQNEWHKKDITGMRLFCTLLSNLTVVLTEKTRQDYMKKFHIRPRKVKCIYNWIDPKLLSKRKPYDAGSRKIMSVGRMGREKGYDLLVKAALKVLPSHPDWEWHIYGEGETSQMISKQIIKEGLDSQLILKGNEPNVHGLYHQYALLVLPSYREGLPLVLLEAKASGLPMVSFDIVTGPNEIIEDGVNGYLIKPYDCQEMADKIASLLDNQEMREEFAGNTKLNLKKFEQQQILTQWRSVID